MTGLPNFSVPNFRVGRREFSFQQMTPVWGDDGELTLTGVTQFAEKHAEACEVARMHERDFFEMINSEELLAVTHDDFPEIDGYYRLTDIGLETNTPFPFHELELELERAGSANDLRFESVLHGTVKTNDFSTTEGSSEPIHAPPLGHTGYDPRHTTTITRSVAYEGSLTVYRDVSYAIDPKWSAEPVNFYRGAATIARRDPLYPQYGPISGTSMFSRETDDIELTNGIVRFWAANDGSGFLNAKIAFWDGTAWREKTLRFVSEGVGIGEIDYVTILQNSPERSTVRYEGAPSSGLGRLGIDVSIGRGDMGVSCLLSSDASTTLGIFDTSLTDMTVTSNRMVYSAADANGHKLMFATTRTFSSTASDAYMNKTSTTRFDVFVGMELSGAAVGNQAPALADQYMATLAESVRALPR